MTDRSPDTDTSDDTRVSRDDDRPPRAPRWVKVFGLVVVALVVAFVILRMAGLGAEHGPGRHFGPGGRGGEAPPSSVTEHRPPAGVPNHSR